MPDTIGILERSPFAELPPVDPTVKQLGARAFTRGWDLIENQRLTRVGESTWGVGSMGNLISIGGGVVLGGTTTGVEVRSLYSLRLSKQVQKVLWQTPDVAAARVGQFKVFGIHLETQAEPPQAIFEGIRGRLTGPVKFFAKLLEVWGLDNNDGAKLLGYEDVRFVRDLLSGASSLRTKDVKDRVRYLFEIDAALGQLFRDEAVERNWLREPRPELDGYSPLDILLEGSMEKLLLVKQYVERISGR